MVVKVHNEIRMEHSRAAHLPGPVCWALCCVQSRVNAVQRVPSCPKTTLMILDSGGRIPLSHFWSGGELNRCANAEV